MSDDVLKELQQRELTEVLWASSDRWDETVLSFPLPTIAEAPRDILLDMTRKVQERARVAAGGTLEL